MAMLITKFHKLIRNRLLWLGFLVVVVFSFVIWGTQMPDAGTVGPNAAGRLDGENISFEEYQQARFNTYLSIVLMTGRPISITPEVEEELHNLAWQRIITLREAADLGITSSDDEVITSIRSFEFLRDDSGQFSQQAYDQFAQNFLTQLRAGKRDFEEHVRQEIIVQKFRSMVERLQLVSPTEITRTFDTLTDRFTVEYVAIEPSLVEQDVQVSEEDIRAYFDNDPAAFTVPEQMVVKAAIFPVAEFAENVEVSDEEIEEYYDFNLDQFALPNEDEAQDTNTFSLTPTEYRPLEEVREEIVAIVKERQAAVLATESANAFVQELSFQRKDGRGVFDSLAATLNVEIVLTSPFSSRQVPVELAEADIELTRQAFNLTDDDDYYYSDPITYTNNVYVLGLVERQTERIPAFEEVRDAAAAQAREFAIFNALTEKAEEIRGSAVAGLGAGLSFDEVMAEYSLIPVKPEAFTINSEDIDPVIASSLVRPLLVLNAGEVSEVVTGDRGFYVGYVKEREVNQELSATAMRPQIVGTLRRQSAQVAFSELQKHLLKQHGFEDLTRRARVDDGSVEETDG
ncbi:MAG: SurA N-terminal domain-containing protein [Kiritimatiellia bacterium]